MENGNPNVPLAYSPNMDKGISMVRDFDDLNVRVLEIFEETTTNGRQVATVNHAISLLSLNTGLF